MFHYDVGLITIGERALSTKMVALWAAFGTNHTPADAAAWPAYEIRSDQSIVMDASALEAKFSVESGLKKVRSADDSAVYIRHAPPSLPPLPPSHLKPVTCLQAECDFWDSLSVARLPAAWPSSV